jgi:HlyD family secretion protein
MQIDTDRMNYSLVAPVDGVIQGMNHIYEGSVLQQGETIGVISPESTMIAECFVPPRDVGLLKRGQETWFQIDAFDYNYFGALKGEILSIEDDYNLVDNQPVFKVRCGFDSSRVALRNGFTGELKKGLTLQARFIVAERTLWQLLFDKLDDWLNPAAPGQLVPRTKYR